MEAVRDAVGKRDLEIESQQNEVIVETQSMTPWSFHPVLLTGLHFLWKCGSNEQEGLWPTPAGLPVLPIPGLGDPEESNLCHMSVRLLQFPLNGAWRWTEGSSVDLLIGACWSWQNSTYLVQASLVISRLQFKCQLVPINLITCSTSMIWLGEDAEVPTTKNIREDTNSANAIL